jgi:hypothetical protein
MFVVTIRMDIINIRKNNFQRFEVAVLNASIVPTQIFGDTLTWLRKMPAGIIPKGRQQMARHFLNHGVGTENGKAVDTMSIEELDKEDMLEEEWLPTDSILSLCRKQSKPVEN